MHCGLLLSRIGQDEFLRFITDFMQKMFFLRYAMTSVIDKTSFVKDTY